MLAVITAIKLTQAVMLPTFSRVLMSCRESMLLLDLRFSTSKFSRLRRLLWWSWIRSYVQFRRDTTLISVPPPPEAVQTGWRPRDDTSWRSDGKHSNLVVLRSTSISHRSRAFSLNGKGYQPGWCAKDILAHCALCRRCSECRIVCASTAMIGWTASRGVLYILKGCCTYPWHLGRKSSQVWSDCNFKPVWNSNQKVPCYFQFTLPITLQQSYMQKVFLFWFDTEKTYPTYLAEPNCSTCRISLTLHVYWLTAMKETWTHPEKTQAWLQCSV